MKKKTLLCLAVSALLFLPGCIADTYELTAEEQDLIAEYAAGVLLRNTEDYAGALLTPIPTLTPTPEPTSTPLPEPTSASGSAGQGNPAGAVSNADLTEVFGLAGLQVEFEGFRVYERYEDEVNSNYVVLPKKGDQLVAAEMKLTNQSGITQEFNFGELKIIYQLDCDGKSFIQPMVTALSGDLLYLSTELSAGESGVFYVLFQTDTDADIEDMNLIVSRGDKTTILTNRK